MSPVGRKKILVCDDNSDIVEMLEMILEREGYQVTSCTDGKRVAGLIAEISPDLVLQDIRMPDLDGYSVLGHLKSAGGDIPPVLIFSAKCLPADVENAIGAGASGFLHKPFTLSELTSEVKKHIK